MRVISGMAKGHKLKVTEGLSIRPTTDRIKESLFNIIAFDLANCNFLDLFSGSGAIGIEALSRGADHAVFVENNHRAYECVIDNLKHTKLENKSEVYQDDVLKLIKILGTKGQKFDIIFMDPPYYENYVDKTLKIILEADVLDSEGYVIVESATKLSDVKFKDFHILKTKKYKTTTMTFLEKLR